MLLALGAATVFTVLARRRRPRTAEPARDPLPAQAMHDALAGMVDACGQQGMGVPGLVMAVVGPESIRLHLSSAAPDSPHPWLATRGGAEWSRPRDGIATTTTTATVPAGLVRLGGLIPVGTDEHIFVDLGQAHGLISIVGDASATARRWIDELSHTPWSAGTPIVLVGLDELATTRTVSNVTVEDVVAAVSAGATGFAFLAEYPSGELGARLLRALESPACRWPVILLGESPNASWRFTAGADGTVGNDALALQPIGAAA